ncbi:MAG: ABC transporter permease [Saprospiraceae bacterium]|nr:ABC transporter permease [Saprospiraceae bacterium]
MKRPKPPKRPLRFLRWYCRPDLLEEIEGDLCELFQIRATESLSRARIRYAWDVLRSFRLSNLKSPGDLAKMNPMFYHYFKISLRSFFRQPGYSTTNVFGLSLGIAVAILLYSYVQYHHSFDQHYADKERIYRITNHFRIGDRQRANITGSGLLAPALEVEIPEIETAGRIYRFGRPLIRYGQKKIMQNSVYYADPQVTRILDFEYLKGNPEDALSQPQSVVLTQAVAETIFGGEGDLLGRTIEVEGAAMVITGIIKDIPPTSHFRPKVLVSLNTMTEPSWDRMGYITYFLLRDQSDIEDIPPKLAKLVERHKLSDAAQDIEVSFESFPVTGIHLAKDAVQEGRGNRKMVNVFLLVAIMIILIASINYMNLATARASRRGLEIGIKKVVGAARKQITSQFLMEAITICLISTLVASLLAFALQDPFSRFTRIEGELNIFSIAMIIKLVVLALFLGILSGSYPALILSSFRPTTIFRGPVNKQGNRLLRRVLVGFQFTVSLILIIATLVVSRQLNFIQNKDLGYNKEAVYLVPLADKAQGPILKQKLMQNKNIADVTMSNLIPAGGDSGSTFTIRNERGETVRDIVSMASVEPNYFELMEFRLKEGTLFSEETEESAGSIIVNQTLVEKYGWKDPIGKLLTAEDEEGNLRHFPVSGVVSDFNMLSLRSTIKPFAFFKLPLFDWGKHYLFIRINSGHAKEALAFIEDQYNLLEKNKLFEGVFLDDYLETVYQGEKRQMKIFLTFAFLTILIACLGLLGLTAYTLETRKKEISIRKVLGAGMGDIFKLVSGDFLWIIIVSGLIAAPVSYLLMGDWLANFSYHISVSPLFILLGICIALAIASMTIIIQTLSSLGANPSVSLKED